MHRAAAERDLDDELRATFDIIVNEKTQAGLSPDEARRAARLELGSIEHLKDQIRDVKAGAFVDALVQDTRYAARLLRRNPLFALTATLSLAIGIGANATIFSVANALLFRVPTGVADPDRIVDIGVSRNDNNGFNPGSYPDYLDIRGRATTFDGVYATLLFGERRSMRTSGAMMAPVFASEVSGNFFTVLGAHPSLGRFFDESDRDVADISPVVLSHRLWEHQFKLDPAIVGQILLLDGRPFAVAGVAADGFHGTRLVAADVWVPIPNAVTGTADQVARLTNRGGGWLAMGGRLRRGVALAQAAAELDAIGRALEREHPDDNRGKTFRVHTASPLPGANVPVGIFLALLMTVVMLVLAVACANVASMLLARAASRRQEIAVRLAMGAPHSRLVRQLLTETLLLFAGGAGAGLLLASTTSTALVRWLPALPFPVDVTIPLDFRVLAFTSGLSFAAALLSGLVPALHCAKASVVWALKDGADGSSGRTRLRSAFVAAQVAFSIVLVVSAGLFVRALQRAGSSHPGFDAHGVELATVDFKVAGYTDETAPAVARAIVERVAALPGIESATLAKALPGGFESLRFGLTVPGEAANARPEISSDTDWNIVEPGYFATLRIPLVSGRDFTAADRAGRRGVAILSEGAARRLWPGENAVGKMIQQHGAPPDAIRPLLVVGVVRDIKTSTLLDGFANPFVYVPLQQHYNQRLTGTMTIAARVVHGGRAAADIRAALAAMNPNLQVVASQTLEDSIALGLMPQRMAASLSSALGTVGLLLAAIGIYGVAAYAVARRTREVGIRIALGARPIGVVVLVLRHGMLLAAFGCGVGLTLAAGISQVLGAFLFGVAPMDPPIFAGAAAAVAVIALAACSVPARRALRISAVEALRYE